MEDKPELQADFEGIKKQLEPYIRPRQEVAHIRRLLALHLQKQVEDPEYGTLSTPLSLVGPSAEVHPTPATVKSHSLRKEYLKALKANIKARQEYAQLSQQTHETKGPRDASNDAGKEEKPEIEEYLELVKKKQKLERLRVLQNYVDELNSKAPDTAALLAKATAKIQLPELPPQILRPVAPLNGAKSSVDLENLKSELEKEVLRAKMASKAENARLAATKRQMEERGSTPRTVLAKEQVMRALEATRDELIQWMEDELAKAGDGAEEDEEPLPNIEEMRSRLEHTRAQVKVVYDEYVEARKRLIETMTGPIQPDLPFSLKKEETSASEDEAEDAAEETGVLSPIIRDLLNSSRRQKEVTQQRSHLSAALTKANSDMVGTLDRLAEESHMLPKYAMPEETKMAKTFAEHMDGRKQSSKTPAALRKAKHWVYASESASLDTMERVCEDVDEGKAALDDAAQTLKRMEDMIGSSIDEKSGEVMSNVDIWSTFDGQLGVL
jgi:hypothetical protein